jgi:excisionase family DNA binding protein
MQNKIITTEIHGITPDEFKESILKDVREELKKLSLNFTPQSPSEYVTRKELSKILKVSVITLADWEKKGIIKGYRIGNLVRYKRSELDHALVELNKTTK